MAASCPKREFASSRIRRRSGSVDRSPGTRRARVPKPAVTETRVATIITEECINCGACEPECPNQAISQGEDIFVIDPALCTECVGFHDEEACAAVCPVDCCIPDQKNLEAEAALLDRAQKLHPQKAFPSLTQLPAHLSRFRRPAA